jgi:hypothetical protein
MEGREVGGDDVFFAQSPTYTVHRILRGMSEKPHHGLRGCATHPDVVAGHNSLPHAIDGRRRMRHHQV